MQRIDHDGLRRMVPRGIFLTRQLHRLIGRVVVRLEALVQAAMLGLKLFLS